MAIINTKKIKNQKRTKHIDKKLHIIREVVVDKSQSRIVGQPCGLIYQNSSTRSFKKHVEVMRMRNMTIGCSQKSHHTSLGQVRDY